MSIRTFRPGDEAAQVSIYNEAAGDFARFKPATLDEIRRRCRARDFDPATRLFAEEASQAVGYVSLQRNGRVGHPWCRKGHERWADPLLEQALQALKQQGVTTAFAAYRGDWPAVHAFFKGHGFTLAREMINFVIDLVEMPTPAARPSAVFSPLRREDLSELLAMAPQVLRVRTAEELERHLFQNPYFKPEVLYVLRARADGPPVAVGMLVENPSYADPNTLDAAMPCFRLGAFGTEGMQVKRVNGLFSFLTRFDRDVSAIGLDLMGQAAFRLRDSDAGSLAAQVPSDVPNLVRFYQRLFRRQGSFPVFERTLG